MTAPWRKAIADFWQERTRTVLVVLAMALGITGFETASNYIEVLCCCAVLCCAVLCY